MPYRIANQCTAMCGCAGAQKVGCGFEPKCGVCEQKEIRDKAKRERANQRRRERDEIMRSLGLTKVGPRPVLVPYTNLIDFKA
jgi:hypothetical protein